MEGRKEIDERERMEEEEETIEQSTTGEDDNNVVKRMPPWNKHLMIRGFVASVIIGVIYNVIVTKLNLTTGLVPNLNVSAALLAVMFIRTWTKLLHQAGFITTSFTREENTIIQTCVVACYNIAG